jgi:hypothetical protein
MEESEAAGDALGDRPCFRADRGALGQFMQQALDQSPDLFAVSTFVRLAQFCVQGRQLPAAPGGCIFAILGESRSPNLFLESRELDLKCIDHSFSLRIYVVPLPSFRVTATPVNPRTTKEQKAAVEAFGRVPRHLHGKSYPQHVLYNARRALLPRQLDRFNSRQQE